MNKKLLIVLAAVLIAGAILAYPRLFVGGDEDIWVCSNGQWVMHGNPSAPKPDQPCGVGDTNTNNNNNSSTSNTACVLLTEAQECRDRVDCLAIDYCNCTTSDERANKCGGTGSGCLCVMGGFHYCASLDCANKNTGDQYYQELERLCTDDCCRSSVGDMERGGYRLAPASGCGGNLRQNTLKCLNSYSWCENANTSIVNINQNYGSKIVYENGQNVETLRTDCDERNGRFEECGDVCSPGAEICVSVCGYTCSDIAE